MGFAPPTGEAVAPASRSRARPSRAPIQGIARFVATCSSDISRDVLEASRIPAAKFVASEFGEAWIRNTEADPNVCFASCPPRAYQSLLWIMARVLALRWSEKPALTLGE